MSEQRDHPPVLDHDGPALSVDLSEADARFRQWMHENLSHAADHFDLTVAGPARLGWLDRSISAPVQAAGRQLWLRVVSEDKQWTGGDFWTGNLDANVFATLAKPQVLDVYEWGGMAAATCGVDDLGARFDLFPHRHAAPRARPSRRVVD